MGEREAGRIGIVLEGTDDCDPEELDLLTRRLRERILELDVERVELTRTAAVPEGAKPGETFALGALAVTLAPIALSQVLALVRSWIENRPVRSVSIEIGEDRLEVQAVSTADQQKLIDTFLRAHAPTDPAPEPTAEDA
ncbi:hypothetical protein STRCI_000607 [Streptomyces cinnabarinus]|uniref:Uncharacterized protein n=1 Tax=Streptomyces cinnabarinus TaxID=67287 RepID=A0ABY7K9D1_9ACTN|nr:hypothetical protein [Streptomyces cinnabarinus]WAZ19549.1 hypothetical protein STRCI_000607 [Streptomyces cinnabarinus]